MEPPLCTSNDFNKTVGTCAGTMRNVTYSWAETEGVPVCEGGASLPQNGEAFEETCPMCEPGTFLTASDTCEVCPKGTFIESPHRTLPNCSRCEENQVALRSLELDVFTSPLNSLLKVECISTDLDVVSNDCLHLRGFKTENGHLTTGSPVPGGVVLSLMTISPLDFQCNITSRQVITDYSIVGTAPSDVRFELLVDGAVAVDFLLTGSH